MLDTLERIGKRDNMTIFYSVSSSSASRTGKSTEKMAPPPFATAKGNAVTQKTFIKHTRVLQVW